MFGRLPDPQEARTIDEFADRLRALKIWAGDPSYETIKRRVNKAWLAEGRPPGELTKRSTVADCFKLGRRRISADLVVAIVQALNSDEGYVTQWRQAVRVLGGEALAAAQVRVQAALPEIVAEFTGRDRELALLGSTGVTAIDGMAGVGKTQLTIRAGHRLANMQPFEHTLFVDLRGFHPDPAQPPADPAAVLDGFLRLLGVAGHQIPYDQDERAALYRQRLADKRVLIVLDNAADESQVEPLLPDSPHCVTLVTSRRDLGGLPGTRRVAVDVFTPAESLDCLLRAMPDIPTDREALAAVAERCGHLPLALSLVVAHMRARPDWTVRDHADWLDERHQDNRLDAGVELALDLSYQDLPPDRQRLLRLLALHPGSEFDAWACAVLAGMDDVHEHMDRLVADNLVKQTGGRFAFHDLVRAFAYDRSKAEDRLAERRAAVSRLVGHYLMTAAEAMDLVFPAERDRRPIIRQTGLARPLQDAETASAWLDAERANLVATALKADAQHKILISATLFRYLDTRGHYSEAASLHQQAQQAAHDIGDKSAEANALTNLGLVHWRQARHSLAASLHNQAIDLAREAGDQRCEARALTNLGGVYWLLERYEDAACQHKRALDILRELGDHIGEAQALGNLGLVQGLLGDHEEELASHQRSYEIFRENGHRVGAARALGNIGEAYCELGRYQLANEQNLLALAELQALGERSGVAMSHLQIGIVYERLAEWNSAAEHYDQAATRFNELGQPHEEARAHRGLADCYRGTGDPDKARTHSERAVRLEQGTS
jgi:tetratricopeptide (TPR) repeat protein